MTDLPHILNWRRMSDLITTSGQPSEAQLAEIAATGVTHVVNLGPHDNKGALGDEGGTVADLGMTYVYIPVDFSNPTDADFDAFAKALTDLSETKIHVHCIYNARVSAFFYRHARDIGGIPADQAFANMDGIWRPGDDWAAFMGADGAPGEPNRYAGEDY